MRRVVRLALAAAALALAAWAVVALTRDDDVPVSLDTPGARRAAAIASEIVPGRVIEVARDSDNGKWEVIIGVDGREHEVELSPRDFSLLRLDYD
jgi:hypothetical protein